MYNRRLEGLKTVGGVVLIIVVVAVIILALVQYYKMIKKCTDNGGEWIRYNCRTIITSDCETDRYGRRSCSISSHEECDEKCVGANAEGQ